MSSSSSRLSFSRETSHLSFAPCVAKHRSRFEKFVATNNCVPSALTATASVSQRVSMSWLGKFLRTWPVGTWTSLTSASPTKKTYSGSTGLKIRVQAQPVVGLMTRTRSATKTSNVEQTKKNQTGVGAGDAPHTPCRMVVDPVDGGS